MEKIKLFSACIFFALLLVTSVHAYKTVFIMNNLFLDYSIESNADPVWLNDSFVVHDKGRIDVKDDGRYILTNARTYYSLLYKAYPDKLTEAWRKYFHGDFKKDVVDYYSQFEPFNVSEDLDLRGYFEKRKQCIRNPSPSC